MEGPERAWRTKRPERKAGRARLTRYSRDRGARGGRVCTAKGAAGGLDDVARIRAAEGRPECPATAPRNNCARADGATPATASFASKQVA